MEAKRERHWELQVSMLHRMTGIRLLCDVNAPLHQDMPKYVTFMVYTQKPKLCCGRIFKAHVYTVQLPGVFGML